jgi:hypothetical protein
VSNNAFTGLPYRATYDIPNDTHQGGSPLVANQGVSGVSGLQPPVQLTSINRRIDSR